MSLRSVHSSTLSVSHSDSYSNDSKEVSISYADCLVEDLEKLKILKNHLLSSVKKMDAKKIESIQACQVLSFDMDQDKQLLINIQRIEVMELQLLIQDIKKQLILLRGEEYEFTRGYVDYLVHQYILALKKILIQYLRMSMNTRIVNDLAELLKGRNDLRISYNYLWESLEFKVLLDASPKELDDNKALLLANLAADGPAIMTLIEWVNANPFEQCYYSLGTNGSVSYASCPLGYGSHITSKWFDFQFKQFYFQHPEVKSLREKLSFFPRDLQELILSYIYVNAYDIVSTQDVDTLRLAAEMNDNFTFKMQLYDLFFHIEGCTIHDIPNEDQIFLSHFDEEFNKKFASFDDPSSPISAERKTVSQKSDPCNAFGTTLLMMHTKILSDKIPALLKTYHPFQEDRRGYSTFSWAIKVRYYNLFKQVIEMYSIDHHIDKNGNVILDDRKQIAHIKKVAMNAGDTRLFTELFKRTSLSLDEYCKLGVPDKEIVSVAAPMSDRFLKEENIIRGYLNKCVMDDAYDKVALALLFLKGRQNFFPIGTHNFREFPERVMEVFNHLFCCKTDQNRLHTFLHGIRRLDNIKSIYYLYLTRTLPTLFENQPSDIIIPMLGAFKKYSENILLALAVDKKEPFSKSIASLLEAKKYDVLFFLLHADYEDKEQFSALARKIKSECERLFKFQSSLSFFSSKPIAPSQVEQIVKLAGDKLKACSVSGKKTPSSP